jgi:phosphopantothenoylcysteine synthetase/decarboxylase
MYGLAPTYICKQIQVMKPSSYSLRRNKDILLTVSHTKTKKTFGDRAFAVAAPKLLNDLPREIRHETNFNKFKALLKTFLFRIAYA